MLAESVERERAEQLAEEVRQRAEGLAQETQLANNLLHTLIDTLPAGVVMTDVDGGVLRVNPAARAILGDAIGCIVRDAQNGHSLHRVDGSRYPLHERPMQRALWRGEITHDVEMLLRRGEGSEQALLMADAPVRDARGDIVSGVAIVQDITERKRAEVQVAALAVQLQAERDTLDVIMENTRAHLAYLDPHFNFIRVNSTYAEGSGHSRAELVGRNHFELFPHPENQMIFETVRDTGQPIEFRSKPFEFADQPERGVTYWDWTLAPVKAADGKAQGLVLSLLDVTESKRAEQQAQRLAALEERQHLARELHDSLSQALYGVALGAHTALTLLDTHRAKVVEALEYIITQADAGLIEMRALVFDLRPESLEREGLRTALKRLAAAIAARHSLPMDISVCDHELPLRLETKESIYRIAQEALNNAAKHARAGQLQVRLRCGEAEVTLEVSDDGIGFDPKGSYPGHLGLRSMSERAAHAGGSLEIDSAPGRGTHVRARFPIQTT